MPSIVQVPENRVETPKDDTSGAASSKDLVEKALL